MRAVLVGCVLVAVALQAAGSIAAAGDPQPVSMNPSSGEARRSVTVSQVSVTYDRAFQSPPDATMTLRDSFNNLVSGHVVTSGGGGASPEMLIFRPDALLSESLSPYTAKASVRSISASDPVVTTWSFAIDDTPPAPPAITSPPEGARLRSVSVSLAGTTANGAPVTVSEGSMVLGTATADSNGNWTLNRTFADGAHEIDATTRDPAGNTSSPSATRTFTVDSTAPAAPVIATPASGEIVSGSSVSISGTAEASSTVAVKEGAAVLGTATAASDGSWAIGATMGDGSHTVTATATDAVGNVSAASAARTFTVDVGPPAIATANPVDHTMVASAYSVAATYTKAIANSSTLRVHDRNNALVSGTSSISGATITFTPSAALGSNGAPYTWTTQGFDNHGNSSPVTTLHFGIGGAPEIALPAAAAKLSTHAVTVKGTGVPGSLVAVRESATEVATATTDADGNWTAHPTFADGAHTVDAVARDSAANTSPPSATRSFLVDTGAPDAPSIASPADGSFFQNPNVAFSGTAESGATVRLLEDSAVLDSATVASGGAWSISHVFDDGMHVVTATVTDAAGNTGPASPARRITVQRASPAAPVVSHPAQGAAVSQAQKFFTGTGAPGNSIAIYEGTARISTATVASSGVWIAPMNIAEGAHTITATQTDPFAHTSAPTAARSFVIDATAPDIHIATPNASLFAPGTTKIEGKADDADAVASITVQFEIPGTGVVLATAQADLAGPPKHRTWTCAPGGLLPGVYVVRATGKDRAGNTGYSAESIVVVSLG